MAKIELNVLHGQCLKRRINNFKEVKREAKVWMQIRNSKKSKINWQFTTKDARIKVKKLYPSIND
jgi:predicted AAA+ superfamily ATPase